MKIVRNLLIGKVTCIEDLGELIENFDSLEVKHFNADLILDCRNVYDVKGWEKIDGTLVSLDNVVEFFNSWFLNINIIIKVDGGKDIVELDDGSYALKENSVFTYDTDEWVLKDNAYYCESNDEWYASDEDLCYVDDGYYLRDECYWCERCEEYHTGNSYTVHVSHRETQEWCEACLNNHAFFCDDCGDVWVDDESYRIDRPERLVCPGCYENNYSYCGECDSTVSNDYYDFEHECCDECSEEHHSSHYVKSYHWHHANSYENKYTLFMSKGKMIRLGNKTVNDTIGIELEVDKEDKDGQDETIESLIELPGLNENEIFFEHDGSLSYGGFEIITGVHTFDSLKAMPWEDILSILKNNGYESHNGGKCGLHVHIGRDFFGRNEKSQASAIGRIYGFYLTFWDDIVKASRRSRFTYCDHPFTEGNKEEFVIATKQKCSEANSFLNMKAMSYSGSHGLALNNCNSKTFEFRLGRGTLKYESFMAWIDLTITIAKNSRHVSIRGLTDCDNWLKGISKETAEYLKSKKAFSESKIIKSLTENEEGVTVCA